MLNCLIWNLNCIDSTYNFDYFTSVCCRFCLCFNVLPGRSWRIGRSAFYKSSSKYSHSASEIIAALFLSDLCFCLLQSKLFSVLVEFVGQVVCARYSDEEYFQERCQGWIFVFTFPTIFSWFCNIHVYVLWVCLFNCSSCLVGIIIYTLKGSRKW